VVEILDSYLAPKEVISMIVMRLDGHQWLPIPKKLQLKQRVNVSDLQAFMTAMPHPDESILTLIISQLVHILHFLHSDRLIVHGDVKPSNFLIDLDYKVKVTDFSTCQDISQSPIQTSFKGNTPL
jgi:serine/threonine protein kinase